MRSAKKPRSKIPSEQHRVFAGVLPRHRIFHSRCKQKSQRAEQTPRIATTSKFPSSTSQNGRSTGKLIIPEVPLLLFQDYYREFPEPYIPTPALLSLIRSSHKDLTWKPEAGHYQRMRSGNSEFVAVEVNSPSTTDVASLLEFDCCVHWRFCISLHSTPDFLKFCHDFHPSTG